MKRFTVEIKDAFKTFTADQDKILTPEETVRRFKDKLKEAELDILEEAVRIDNGRLDIPVFFSNCGKDARKIIGTKKQMGKGATPRQAEASACMELAERFSFFSFCKNEDNFITSTYNDLEEKDQAIPFEMIAKSVHDESDDLAITQKIYEALPIKWTWGYNLTKKESVLVPFDWFFAINEFNGPSAGNCIEEAISQGICEIVERHTSSLISHGKIKTPLIDPATATDEKVLEMLEKYKNIGIKLFLSDFSLDTGIPNVGVMAYDPSTFPDKSEIIWTAGTTPCPEKALSRALTEVAQLAGDFNTDSNYVASGLPKFYDLTETDFITNPGKTISLKDLPDLSDNNIKTEVENLLSILEKNGMEVIVIDTMHDKLQIPAFYTIIPGAHFRERARGTSVGMFSAKIISEKLPAALALQTLTKIDQMLQGKYYIKFYMGTLALSLNKPEEALDHLNTALNLDPFIEDIPSIYSYMGVCLKDMERYEDALDVLSKGEKLDQERTDIYNLMGFCHFKLKNHPDAVDCFKKAIKLNPSSAIDYANLAINYRETGETEKAIKNFELALALDSSIDFARSNLIKLLIEQETDQSA